MTELTDDLIVVIPGIMGSTLSRIDPDTGDRTPLWEPSGAGAFTAVRTLFRSIRSLELPEGIGDDHPGDNVAPMSLVGDIRMPLGLWTFDVGYTALVDMIKKRFHVQDDPDKGPVNLITFPYDWRLSNRFNGARLGTVVEPALEQWRAQGGRFADAQVTFICHSMGGLVARWYIDHLGGASITRGLITLGTPHRGAAKAVEQLVNGIRIGPKMLCLNLTSLARSLPSIHQLLPQYACIDSADGLQNLRQVTLPEVDAGMVADAMDFHDSLAVGRTSSASQYTLRPIVGFKQRTATTLTISGTEAHTSETILGNNERGDATVPRLSATPQDVDPALGLTIADNHGGIIHNGAAFDLIEGYLTGSTIVHKSAMVDLAVTMPETVSVGEEVTVQCEIDPDAQRPIEMTVTDHTGRATVRRRLGRTEPRADTTDDQLAATWRPTEPGIYRVSIQGATRAALTAVRTIDSVVTVWPDEQVLDLTIDEDEVAAP